MGLDCLEKQDVGVSVLAMGMHEYDTWLASGHTVPAGNPPEPYAPNTKLCCALISNPVTFGEEFNTLGVSPAKTINFYAFIPLYQLEVDFKLKKGVNALQVRLSKSRMRELIDVNRPNVCPKLLGLF